MDIINNIDCTPSLLANQRAKIKEYLGAKLKAVGLNINDFDFQQQTIKKTTLIENSKLNLKFGITGNAKEFASDRKIADNDVFVVTGYSLGFLKTPLKTGSTTDYESIENNAVIYFNSHTVFTYTDTGKVSQAKALESLYHSTLSITAGNDNLVTNFDTRNLKRTPCAKVEGVYNYKEGHFYPATEYPILNGDDNIDIRFDVPAADTDSASGEPGVEKTYVVLELQGFNISQLAKPYQAMDTKCIK
jgi:hypothetical protein